MNLADWQWSLYFTFESDLIPIFSSDLDFSIYQRGTVYPVGVADSDRIENLFQILAQLWKPSDGGWNW